MSKLKELIRELCPDGVEYKKLGVAVSIERGKRLVRDQLSDDCGYPVFQNSMTPLGYHTDYNYPENTAFIIGAGAAGEIGFSSVKFWAADDCYPMVCREDISSRYLYHALLRIQPQIKSRVRKASIPRLSRASIEQLEIPVPPLPVQSEIVRILDNFTVLTAELTAELTARKKQYEFYRDKLLTFGDVRGGATSDVVWRTLGDVCNLQSGKAISAYLISDTQTAENPIPCYGANGLRGYVSTSNESGDKPIVGRQGALCGNVCFATGSYYATEHAVVVTDKGFFNSRFLYHLLVNADLNQYKTAGAQPGLSVTRLNEVKVPVPTRTVQDRIASVLDNFDAICSDLKIGLPAEIEARQKQYEFYRDALLTYAATGKTILTDRQTDRQTDRRV